MAISAIAAVAAKEVVAHAAREAATQAAREIAQKMATESATQTAGHEIQASVMERQAVQDGFRVGEMPDAKGEGREVLKEKESDAADELRGKMDAEGGQPDAGSVVENEPIEVQNTIETEMSPATESQEVFETQESVDSAELVETQEGAPVAEQSTPTEYNLITRNQSLEGDVHPVTGVPFEQKTVIDAEGNKVTGVFPKFESGFDAQLPEDMLKASDKEQFAECNKQLGDAVSKDPATAKKFTGEQCEQIANGDTPDGYTWHHNEERGKMQLVETDVHAQTGHTGGRSIWGGGSEFRA